MHRFLKFIWDKFSDNFGNSIFHPQYLIKKNSFKAVIEAQKRAHGKLLDIGCGRMPYRSLIEPKVAKYIGLDHPKTSRFYVNSRIKPDIFADARKIPVKNKSFDTILLLEVLEHIPYPINVLKEVGRIIKPNGVVIISTPFMYPLHDIEYDYLRYTKKMLKLMLKKSGFKIISIKENGNFFEFMCISIIVYLLYRAKDIDNFFKYFLIVLVMPLSIFLNIVSLPFSSVNVRNNRFPLNYTVVARLE